MGLVLTPGTDAGTGAPYVQVEVDSPPAAAETVTVERTSGGRTMDVRGLINLPADGASQLDFESGTGWLASYRARYFDASGNFLEYSLPQTITLPSNGDSYAWVHNPLDPTTSVRVTMLAPAANVLRRPVPAQKFSIPGRSAPVTIFGTRQSLTGLVLDCLTTEEQADRFDALFGGYDDAATIPILCFRTNPEMRLPATLFALISDPQQVPYVLERPDHVMWQLTADEVAPPPAAIVTSLLSYEDFTVFYTAIGDGDYEEFEIAYTDYTEASRDYSIAGTA